MGNLSANLSRHEFECKCGCGLNTIDAKTVQIIQDVCDHFCCSVIISSGCRCYEYNRRPVSQGGPGSNDRSQHPRCRAGDCEFPGVLPGKVYDYLIKKYPGEYGFGLYDWGIHIDSRSGNSARWEN